MNAECATLHLMSMGVPARTAKYVAEWITDSSRHQAQVVYTERPHNIVLSTKPWVEELCHYRLWDASNPDAYLAMKSAYVVVWDRVTGFNPAFRHPETSLT